MAERKRRSGRSPWITAVGLALLAIPGFAVGLVAGVAWEDPGLLFQQLLGGGREVAWGREEAKPTESPATYETATAAPAPKAPLPDVGAEPPPSMTRIRPEVVSPGGAARFAVQVGAFSESSAAEKLAESLRRKGFSVYVSAGAQAGEKRWRVRVGPVTSREEAERTATRLKAEEKLPTWVLDEDAA